MWVCRTRESNIKCRETFDVSYWHKYEGKYLLKKEESVKMAKITYIFHNQVPKNY